MKARQKEPEPLPVGKVVSVRPALLRDRDAGTYLARSPSWIRAARAADVKSLREGREPTGPKWIRLGPSIFYKIADLDRWVAANEQERGVISFSNRGATATDGAKAVP